MTITQNKAIFFIFFPFLNETRFSLSIVVNRAVDVQSGDQWAGFIRQALGRVDKSSMPSPGPSGITRNGPSLFICVLVMSLYIANPGSLGSS